MLTGLAAGNREPAMELFFHKENPKSYSPMVGKYS
jgi:hypothetical protein